MPLALQLTNIVGHAMKCWSYKKKEYKNRFYLFHAISLVQTNKEVKYWIALTEKQAIFTTTVPLLWNKQTPKTL